jgi:hypothetical protein
LYVTVCHVRNVMIYLILLYMFSVFFNDNIYAKPDYINTNLFTV